MLSSLAAITGGSFVICRLILNCGGNKHQRSDRSRQRLLFENKNPSALAISISLRHPIHSVSLSLLPRHNVSHQRLTYAYFLRQIKLLLLRLLPPKLTSPSSSPKTPRRHFSRQPAGVTSNISYHIQICKP